MHARASHRRRSPPAELRIHGGSAAVAAAADRSNVQLVPRVSVAPLPTSSAAPTTSLPVAPNTARLPDIGVRHTREPKPPAAPQSARSEPSSGVVAVRSLVPIDPKVAGALATMSNAGSLLAASSPMAGSEWGVVRAPPVVIPPTHELAAESALVAETYFKSHHNRMKLLHGALYSKGLDPLSHWPNAAPTQSVTAAGSAGRAPLAIELEIFLKKELYALTAGDGGAAGATHRGALVTTDKKKSKGGDAEGATNLQKAPVYREILACLSNHFPEYNIIFSHLVNFYDVITGELRAVYRTMQTLQTDYDSVRDRFHSMLSDARSKYEHDVAKLRGELAGATASLGDGSQRERMLGDEIQRLMVENDKLKFDLADAVASNRLFAANLNDINEKGLALVKTKHKLTKENESLRHMVLALESKVKNAEFDVMVEQAARSNVHQQRSNLRQRAVAQINKKLVKVRAETSGNSPPLEGPTASAGASPTIDAGGAKEGSGSRHSGGLLHRAQSVVSVTDGGDDNIEVDADLPQDIQELHEHALELENKLKRLARSNLMLQTENKTLMQRIEGLLANFERDQQDMTPRPGWEQVVTSFPTFPLSELSTSREILEELLDWFKDQETTNRKELEVKALSQTVRQWLGEENSCESDLQGKHRFFVCKGTGEHVPVYLRYRGTVRNRKMSKGDVEKLLSRFWTARRNHLRTETTLNAMPLGDFLLSFLTQYSGSSRSAVELSYNLFAVCEMNNHDPDCSMFLRIFRRELSEFAMYDQHDVLSTLQAAIADQDKSQKGKVSRFAVHRVLSTLFPAKSKHDMMRLRFALIVSAKGAGVVDYEALFHEDEEGNQSKFVTLLRAQHVEEVTGFTVEVEEALRDVIRDHAIDLNEARIAMKRLDPDMPNTRIEEIVAFGCGLTEQQLAEKGQFYRTPAEPFLQRVRAGILVKRYGRKINDEGEEEAEYDDDENRPELDIAQLDEIERERFGNADETAQAQLEAVRGGQASFTNALESLYAAQRQAMEQQRDRIRKKKVEKVMKQVDGDIIAKSTPKPEGT